MSSCVGGLMAGICSAAITAVYTLITHQFSWNSVGNAFFLGFLAGGGLYCLGSVFGSGTVIGDWLLQLGTAPVANKLIGALVAAGGGAAIGAVGGGMSVGFAIIKYLVTSEVLLSEIDAT